MASSLNITVGLEIHVRLDTDRKIFCTCANRFGAEPNRHTCPVCLGLPGSLPVLNAEVVEPAARLALALGCQVQPFSEFSRKNYFYPDLPRNYQITQFEHPLATAGEFLGVGIARVHLEEDAGRTVRSQDGPDRVDLNRAGTPLAEIVTQPDLRNGPDARAWLGRLRQLVRHLGVGDGDMEKGSLRCDANVGIGPGHPLAGPWVEIKNLNSMKHVGQALDQEIARLSGIIGEGRTPQRETRGWDAKARLTTPLRLKEDTGEYLFFPEPDLPPLIIPAGRVQAWREELGERPHEREARWVEEALVSPTDATVLGRSSALAGYFEDTVSALVGCGLPRGVAGATAAPWILGKILEAVGGRDEALGDLALTPELLAKLVAAVQGGRVSRLAVLERWEEALAGDDIAGILRAAEATIISEESLEMEVEIFLQENSELVARYVGGQTSLLNHFVGKVMGALGSGAEPQRVRATLMRRIGIPGEASKPKKPS